MDMASYTVPVIVGICMCAGYCVKSLVRSDRAHDFIPLGCMVLGTAVEAWMVAIAGQPFTPDAMLAGMASGLAATGGWELVTHIGGGSDEG